MILLYLIDMKLIVVFLGETFFTVLKYFEFPDIYEREGKISLIILKNP